MRDLVAQNFAPVYLLMGDEPYFIDKISAYIEEHALQPEEKDFNQVVAFGISPLRRWSTWRANFR